MKRMDAKTAYDAIVYSEKLEVRGARRLAIAYHGFTLLLGLGLLAWLLAPIARAERPAPVPPDTQDTAAGQRFGLPASERRAIFTELAALEPDHRAKAKEAFPEQEWSQEDHRCAFERDAVRNLAARRSLSMTQVYLILDEGIRERWPDAQGHVLRATTVPVTPRRM